MSNASAGGGSTLCTQCVRSRGPARSSLGGLPRRRPLEVTAIDWVAFKAVARALCYHGAVDEAFKQRAERRRATWKGGKVTLSEAEEQDAQFWAALSPAERLATVWSLAEEAYGQDANPAGLRGSPSGVRRR